MQAAAQRAMRPVTPAAPRLLVEWEPWWPSFLRNVWQAFSGGPLAAPAPGITSSQSQFWTDVFVERPLPWLDISLSAALHGAVALALVFGTRIYRELPQVSLDGAYHSSPITYYQVSAFLPEVKTSVTAKPAPKAAASADVAQAIPHKAQPALAVQQAISAPQSADNSTQTIMNALHPPIIKQDVPLPNIVAMSPVPQAPPTAALTDSRMAQPKISNEIMNEILPPSPDARRAAQVKLPNLTPQAVEPAEMASRKIADVSIERLTPAIALPKITVEEQQAESRLPDHIDAKPVPPPPSPETAGNRGTQKAAGSLLALSLRPAPPPVELRVPDGSRSGAFAAGPDGKAGAPGIPMVPLPIVQGASRTANKVADLPSANAPGAMPVGISITGIPAGEQARPPGPVVQGVPKDVAQRADAGNSSQRHGMFDAPSARSSMRPPAMTASLDRGAAPPFARRADESAKDESAKLEDKVFAGRRSYSMEMNMPSLTSASSSWVIHFAEMGGNAGASRRHADSHDSAHDSSNDSNAAKSSLITPDPIHKVDPGYPAELMRERVEGLVVLYAVIRADGRVTDVRVLEGFNDQLDENARKALAGWLFRPAMRNGTPVELEAVVQVPFRAKKF